MVLVVATWLDELWETLIGFHCWITTVGADGADGCWKWVGWCVGCHCGVETTLVGTSYRRVQGRSTGTIVIT